MNETTDARGREVYTVHPQILTGGAEYRHVSPSGPANQTEDPQQPGPGPDDEAIDVGRHS